MEQLCSSRMRTRSTTKGRDMKNQTAKSFQLLSHTSAILVRVFVFLLASSLRVPAPEDPPGCGCNGGEFCNPTLGSLNFNVAQAHIGDTVTLIPSLGVAA